MRECHHIAIFTRQLNFMGGIERVVIEQIRIFQARGIKVTLLIEQSPDSALKLFKCQSVVLPQVSRSRVNTICDIASKSKPDMVIFHGLSIHYAQVDIEAFRKLSVPTIAVIHFPFHQTIALDRWYNAIADYLSRSSGCNAIATVNTIDAFIWRALGKKAFHVQNPFVHPPKNVETIRRTGVDGAANLLWVGRLCEPKQPKSALAAFALAAKDCPNITLTMVGGDERGIRQMHKEAVKLGVAEKVKFVSERPDISEYWAKADIHLLTSICESFCLVWAEAKAAGIPTVMFELPYLELAEDKRGYVAVEQKDVQALADAIVGLVNNAERRLALGEEARESLARFNDEAVWQSWCKLFDGLKDPKAGLEVDPDLAMIVRQMYFAVCHDKETHRWPEEMASDWQRLTRTSMRPFARILGKAVKGLVSIKRRIRG